MLKFSLKTSIIKFDAFSNKMAHLFVLQKNLVRNNILIVTKTFYLIKIKFYKFLLNIYDNYWIINFMWLNMLDSAINIISDCYFIYLFINNILIHFFYDKNKSLYIHTYGNNFILKISQSLGILVDLITLLSWKKYLQKLLMMFQNL